MLKIIDDTRVSIEELENGKYGIFVNHKQVGEDNPSKVETETIFNYLVLAFKDLTEVIKDQRVEIKKLEDKVEELEDY